MVTINCNPLSIFDSNTRICDKSSLNYNDSKKSLTNKTGNIEPTFSKPQSPIVNNIEHYRNIYASPENFIKRQVNYEKMKVADEKYRKEIERRKSFSKVFPSNLQHLIIPMAKSGFYFIGNETERDKVKCIFCQGILYKWNKNDVPERDHKRSYPTCPLLLNLNVGNVPVEENVEKFLSSDPDLNYGDEILFNIVSSFDKISQLIPIRLEFDLETRENTFKKFEHLKDLVFEGLYVIEKVKINYLKCCECGHEIEILKNIGKLSHDVFHNKNCSYIKLDVNLLTNQSLNECENEKKENFCKVEYSITDEEIEARMDSRTANKMEKFCQDRDKVRKLITNRLKGTGKDYESMLEILQDVKDYKDIEIIECSKFEFIFQEYTCVVCLDNIISEIFLPCGHFKTCKRCSKSLSSCPVCRKLILKRVSGIRLRETNDS